MRVLAEPRFREVARLMHLQARATPPYDGTLDSLARVDACTVHHVRSGTRLVFTRDVGLHSSGWLANPDFERCWHLSLSVWTALASASPELIEPPPRDLRDRWLAAFFDRHVRHLVIEPPLTATRWALYYGSAPGARQQRGVAWHFRLFVDVHGDPITPRGEVYDRTLTEVGWQTYSEVRATRPART